MPGLAEVLGSAEEEWSARQTLEGHSDYVSTVSSRQTAS
jgi:hypothetical protein